MTTTHAEALLAEGGCAIDLLVRLSASIVVPFLQWYYNSINSSFFEEEVTRRNRPTSGSVTFFSLFFSHARGGDPCRYYAAWQGSFFSSQILYGGALLGTPTRPNPQHVAQKSFVKM